jgi:hypothetical protein
MARPQDFPRFTISTAALRHIEWVRTQYAEAFPSDPPAMADLGLGGQLLENGEIGSMRIVVGFWRQSEFKPSGYPHVQRVSGVDLVCTVPSARLPDFEGKELHFTPEDGLFLRNGS